MEMLELDELDEQLPPFWGVASELLACVCSPRQFLGYSSHIPSSAAESRGRSGRHTRERRPTAVWSFERPANIVLGVLDVPLHLDLLWIGVWSARKLKESSALLHDSGMLPLELRLPTSPLESMEPADSRWKTELSAEEVLFCLITTACCWSLLFYLLMTSQCVAVCLPVGLAEWM